MIGALPIIRALLYEIVQTKVHHCASRGESRSSAGIPSDGIVAHSPAVRLTVGQPARSI
jgi:hypothetical protein